MWDKIIAGIVAILLIGLAVGAMVPSGAGGEGDHGGVSSLTLVVENVDKDTTEKLTLEVPGSISLTRNWLRSAGILDNPSAFTTITDPDETWNENDTIKVHAVTEVWWSSENIKTMEDVEFSQSGSTSAGYPFETTDGNTDLATSENIDKENREESNALPVEPTDYFQYYRDVNEDGTIESVPLTASNVDGGSVDATVEIFAVDDTDTTVKDTVHLSADIELEINDDGSLSLGAELTEVDTESQ